MTWDASSHLCPVSKPKAVSSSSSPNASRLRLRTHHLTDSLVGKLSGEYRAQGTPHSGTGVVAASRDPREGLCSAAPPGVPQHVTAGKKPNARGRTPRTKEERQSRSGACGPETRPVRCRPSAFGHAPGAESNHISPYSQPRPSQTIFLV